MATDAEVGAQVCGPTSAGVGIHITQPTGDSVVNQPVTTFRADVDSASQVVVEVDGTYNNTVAMASNQTSFSTDITLTEGTHTVTMTANDICGGPDASDSVVLTYHKATEPSNGSITPTEVDEDATVQPAGTTDVDTIKDDDIAQQIEQLPVIGAAVSVVSDFIAASGLEATFTSPSGVGSTLAGVSRVGLTVAAMTSVVMASSLAPVAAQAVPGLSEAFSVSSHRSMLYLGWIIRGAGVFALALAYFV